MDRTWTRRGMAAAQWIASRVNAGRIRPQQLVHLGVVLAAVLAVVVPPAAAQDISFDPNITQEEFHQFSTIVGQSIFPTPVDPARGRGLFGFDIGVAATGIQVDENAQYWIKSVNSDLLKSGYLIVPRIVASKGLGVLNVSASYARIPDTSIDIIGGAIDVPIIDGGLLKPTLAVRGSYGEVRGVDVFGMKTYGVEAFLSKGFGPLTPYAAVGETRFEARGDVVVAGFPELHLRDNTDHERYTVGLRISMLIPKIVLEASQGEERSYTAKVSFGL